MQPAKLIQTCARFIVLSALLAACQPTTTLSSRAFAGSLLAGKAASFETLSGRTASRTASRAASQTASQTASQITVGKPATNQPLNQPTAGLKTEAAQGEFIGPALDCDGDGLDNESRIDFDGDGVSDECVEGPEAIPEPPFQQTYTPTSETFYGALPAVGWTAQYQCGDGLYDVTLRRPSEDKVEYTADGLTLSSSIVYDDIDPNLNQPLMVEDPTKGVRYSFSQEQAGEFYEYAIADYDGSVGLYVYQTGEQVVAAPCSPATGATATDPAATESAVTEPATEQAAPANVPTATPTAPLPAPSASPATAPTAN